jgi:hypothetical protein
MYFLFAHLYAGKYCFQAFQDGMTLKSFLLTFLVVSPTIALAQGTVTSPRYPSLNVTNGVNAGSINLSGTGSTGDVSGMSVTATGGSTARTNATRAADSINVLDQNGVDASGVSDSAPGFSAASSAAGTTKQVYVPPGVYKLGSGVTTPAGQVWEFVGTTFTGAGSIGNTGDWTAFQGKMGHGWTSSTASPGNNFGTFTYLGVGVTGATSSYEKDAGYDLAVTSDPTSYTQTGTVGGVPTWSAAATLDTVARHMMGQIATGNMTGRAWGGVSMARTNAGSDGALIAHEFDLINTASDAPYPDQPTSKTGVAVVAIGNYPSTTGVSIGSQGGAQFHNGILVRQASIADYAFRILPNGALTGSTAYITPSGDTMFQSVTVGSGGAKISPTGSGANMGLALAMTGTGGLTLNVPDSTTTGGNARGPYALDLQSNRVSASQVASGTGSAILGGQNNTASGQNCTVVGGGNHVCDATFGVTMASTASTLTQKGKVAIGAGAFSVNGDAQMGIQVLRTSVTSTSAATLTTDGAALGANNLIILPNSGVFELSCKMVVRDTVSGDAALFYLDNALFTRGASASTTAVVGSPAWTAGAATAGMSGVLTAAVSADTTNGGVKLQLTATNGATHTHHAVARCLTTEVR